MFTRIVGGGIAEGNPKPGVDAPTRCFALVPLYARPVTRGVDVSSLNADGTLADATAAAMFADIDVEVWARRFLGDLDRFLAAAASPGLDGQVSSAVLARAAQSKHAIVSAIADQLKGLFDYSPCETDCDPAYRKALQAARDTLMQQLQVSLAKGYDIPVVAQYDTGVPAPASELEHQGSTPGSADTAAHPPSHSAAPRLAARTGAPRFTARTPAPLRTHPAHPDVVEQTASPTFDLPTDLQQLPLWTYKLVLAHEFAAQDTVMVTAEFNLVRRPTLACFDLFDVLAQYIAVADRLWRMPGLPSGGDGSAANAAATFADLAARVAAHWRIRLPHKSREVPESEDVAGTSHAVGVRMAYSQDGGTIESVSFVREGPQPDLMQRWPEVDLLLPDGSSAALVAQPSDPSSVTAVYVPAQGAVVPASARQTLRLAWSGLNVAAFQNARSRVSVVRNEDLAYDPLHPEMARQATDPAFVYRTADVLAGTIAPLIERNQPQEMSGANLRAALEDAIQTLFPPEGLVADMRAAWQLDYSHELGSCDTSPDASPPVRVRLPVALYPDAPWAGIAEVLAGAGKAWIDTHQPASDGASWMLNVALKSGLGSAGLSLFNADLSYDIAATNAAAPQ